MTGVIGFLELGAIFLAWLIIWSFVLRAFSAQHADNPIVSGLAAILF